MSSRVYYRDGMTVALPGYENVQPHVGLEVEVPGDLDMDMIDQVADLVEEWVEKRLERKRQEIAKQLG